MEPSRRHKALAQGGAGRFNARMKGFLSAAAMSLVLLAVHPARAKTQPSVEKAAAMSDSELADAMDKIGDDPGYCISAGFWAELEKRHPSSRTEAMSILFSATCDQQNDQPASAFKKFNTFEGLAPVELVRQVGADVDQHAMLTAVMINNFDGFVEHAGHVARRNSAEEYARLVTDMFDYGFDRASVDKRDEVALEFARSPVFGSLPYGIATRMAIDALRPALAEHDLDLARKMVPHVGHASDYRKVLVSRDFAEIWPDVESRVGPHMRTALEADIARSRQAMEANPDDMQKRVDLVAALHQAGHDKEAIEAASVVDHSPKAVAAFDEEQAWVLNYEVDALDSLGRVADGDRIFEQIAAYDPEKKGWVVNFVINRAGRLYAHGEYAKALPASQLAVNVAANHGSPYAKTDAAMLELCVSLKLAPATDVSALWEQIDAHHADAIASAVEAAQCMGKTKVAVAYMREGLADPAMRDQVIMMLEPDDAAFRPNPLSRRKNPRVLLSADPELVADYQRYARDLPEPYRPQALAPVAAPQNKSVSM